MISRNTYQRKDGAGNQVFIQIVINPQKEVQIVLRQDQRIRRSQSKFIPAGTLRVKHSGDDCRQLQHEARKAHHTGAR